MGENTLTDRSTGQTITDAFFNSIHQALNGTFVGRNATGVPTANQALGSTAIPWGVGRFGSLIVGGQAIDPSSISVPQNIVKSGAKRTSSNQAAYLVPNGAALSAVIDASPTNLVYDINGSEVSMTADTTLSGLTAAPSSQNTALVNDADAADQLDTRVWGEIQHRKPITIDTVGTNITALVGKWAAFKIAGTSTEYFLAFVESATKLSRCYRGFFYDSSKNPINRAGFSNNDVITLMKLGWVFAENDGTTTEVSYTNPVWAFNAPNSPASGDYWYDLTNNVWKRYDGASFLIINRTLIGMVVNDTTACVAARSVDFFVRYNSMNTLMIDKDTSEIAKVKNAGARLSVAGMEYAWEYTYPSWNITNDLAGSADMYSATEQASRPYYLYVKDTGDEVISDISPYFRADQEGEYHPHNPWRCVGFFYNNGSSDIEDASGIVIADNFVKFQEFSAYGSGNVAVATYSNKLSSMGGFVAAIQDSTDGDSLMMLWPGVVQAAQVYGRNTVSEFGITLNVTSAGDLDLPPSNLTEAQRLIAVSSGSGIVTEASRVCFLYMGDVIRSQGDPGHTTAAFAAFDRFEVVAVRLGMKAA